jgi:hypothetical protein
VWRRPERPRGGWGAAEGEHPGDGRPESDVCRREDAYHKNKIALSWFKDSAVAALQRTRRLAEILESCGVAVEMITTERPGFLVYEDEYQVVAEPFADTGA